MCTLTSQTKPISRFTNDNRKQQTTHFHVTLCSEIVDLIRTNAVDDRHDVRRVSEVDTRILSQRDPNVIDANKMQFTPRLRMEIFVNVINTSCVEA